MSSSIRYVTKAEESGAQVVYKQVLDSSSGNVIFEEQSSLLEVRLVSPESLSEYFLAVANQIRDTADHLSSVADGSIEVNSETFNKAGVALVALRHLVDRFDPSMMPPSVD